MGECVYVYPCVTTHVPVCSCEVCARGACGHDCVSVYAQGWVCDECVCVHSARLGEGRGAEGAVGYIFAKLLVCLWADRSGWVWVWSCLL